MYASNDWAHDVVTTLNQRQWRWFNVVTTSLSFEARFRCLPETSQSRHSTAQKVVYGYTGSRWTRIPCTKNDMEVNAWRRKHTRRKWNERNGDLGHFCAHVGWAGPGKPHEDGEMNKMTLSSRHRIWNWSSGCLRLTTLLFGHIIESLRESGEETFCFFEAWMQERGSSPRSPISKQATSTCLTTAAGLPPHTGCRTELREHVMRL